MKKITGHLEEKNGKYYAAVTIMTCTESER